MKGGEGAVDDLMNKLQNVLNDKESMNQIKELANMLTSQMPQDQTAQPESPKNAPQAPDLSSILSGLSGMIPQQPSTGTSPGLTPAAGSPIGGQGMPQSSAIPPAPDFDAAKLLQLGQVISSARKPDKNIDLLMALRPLLKEENQIKIDRLIKIFRLFAVYPALKESGLLGGDLFGLL